MMVHTEGPWKVNGKPGYEAPEIRAAGRRIARVLYHLGSEDNEVDANAALIAAAPDLLAACELGLKTIALMTPFPTSDEDTIINRAIIQAAEEADEVRAVLYAAIAQAKGIE